MDNMKIKIFNLNKKKSSGFTIVEILVVIAIMIVVFSITMMSVSNVKDRTSDLVVKSNLQLLRTEARKYIDQYGNFGTATVATPTNYPPVDGSSLALCSTANTILANPKMNSYIVEAEKNADPSSKWVALCAIGKQSGDVNATSWAVAVRLKENAGNNNGSADGYYYWCVGYNQNGRLSGGVYGGGPNASAECM